MDVAKAKNLIDLIETSRKEQPDAIEFVISNMEIVFSKWKEETLLEGLRAFALHRTLTFIASPPLLFGLKAYQVTLLPEYEAFKKDILDQFYGIVPIKAEDEALLGSTKRLPASKNDKVEVQFDDLNRSILLNDSFLIAQPAYDSENYRFFEYVWNNPNRNITVDELNRNLEEPLKKPLSKILENLNFRGALKDAFFQVSKTTVCFTPSRSIEELKQARLYPLRLFAAQKAVPV